MYNLHSTKQISKPFSPPKKNKLNIQSRVEKIFGTFSINYKALVRYIGKNRLFLNLFSKVVSAYLVRCWVCSLDENITAHTHKK